jgi:hypothetical protein
MEALASLLHQAGGEYFLIQRADHIERKRYRMLAGLAAKHRIPTATA